MSFANQALCAQFIAQNKGKLSISVMRVPDEIDNRVAALALKALGNEIDTLTPEQQKYLASWH